MELAFDSLSLVLLVTVLVLAGVHLVLLRKPEPATHPLLLGRQAELNRVRKANESPAFISSTAGLGGLAKQLLKDTKSVADIWTGKGTRIFVGAATVAVKFDDAVWSLRQHFVQGGLQPGRDRLTIKLDDPSEALLADLAIASVDQVAPLHLSSASALGSYGQSPVTATSLDLANLKDALSLVKADRNANKRLILINPTAKAPQIDPSKIVGSDWNFTTIIAEALGKGRQEAGQQEPTVVNAVVARMIVPVAGKDAIIDVSTKNIINGGVVSILSIFPTADKPTSEDRILSFESTNTPYGYAVALAAGATGATLRLCSPQRGITSKLRMFDSSVIFCTTNELNAIRAGLKNQLNQVGSALLTSLAWRTKLSLLRSGNVSRTTIWDSLIYNAVRSNVVGSNLRCIICSTDESACPSQEALDFLRVVLGVPIVITLSHPLVAGPIANTLYRDFQRFTDDTAALAHVGGPSATMECKLINTSEDQAALGVYRGELAVKGPAVLSCSTSSAESHTTKDGWTKTIIWADLRPNGTIQVVKSV